MTGNDDGKLHLTGLSTNMHLHQLNHTQVSSCSAFSEEETVNHLPNYSVPKNIVSLDLILFCINLLFLRLQPTVSMKGGL